MRIPVEVSARHVHLSQNDWSKLFGRARISTYRPISQPGQFLAKQRVSITGPKGTYRNVAVLGPLRKHSQVELSATDCRHLGIEVSYTISGQLSSAKRIRITGTRGSIARKAAIVPLRHIHVDTKTASVNKLLHLSRVSVLIKGERGGRLDNVVVRVDNNFVPRLHIDTDEGNALGIAPGCQAFIEK